MVLAMTSATWRESARAEAQVAAIEQQRVILLAVGGDELVHDAAVCADKLVFGALAKPGQHRARVTGADERENGKGRNHFKRGGAGNPEPRGTSPQDSG